MRGRGVYLNKSHESLFDGGLKKIISSLTAVSVLIKSDRRASLGRVVEVWDLCRDMGISQVNIATNQE